MACGWVSIIETIKETFFGLLCAQSGLAGGINKWSPQNPCSQDENCAFPPIIVSVYIVLPLEPTLSFSHWLYMYQLSASLAATATITQGGWWQSSPEPLPLCNCRLKRNWCSGTALALNRHQHPLSKLRLLALWSLCCQIVSLFPWARK